MRISVPGKKYNAADQDNCGRDHNAGAQKLTERFIQLFVSAG